MIIRDVTLTPGLRLAIGKYVGSDVCVYRVSDADADAIERRVTWAARPDTLLATLKMERGFEGDTIEPYTSICVLGAGGQSLTPDEARRLEGVLAAHRAEPFAQ